MKKTLYTIFPYAIAIIGAISILPKYPAVSWLTFGLLTLAIILHALAWYVRNHRSNN